LARARVSVRPKHPKTGALISASDHLHVKSGDYKKGLNGIVGCQRTKRVCRICPNVLPTGTTASASNKRIVGMIHNDEYGQFVPLWARNLPHNLTAQRHGALLAAAVLCGAF
jgi:hypothetical protein